MTNFDKLKEIHDAFKLLVENIPDHVKTYPGFNFAIINLQERLVEYATPIIHEHNALKSCSSFMETLMKTHSAHQLRGTGFFEAWDNVQSALKGQDNDK